MGRRTVNLRMDDDARAAWRELCSKHGVSLTTLIDALGHEVARDPRIIPRRVIERARALDTERKAR